MATLKISDLSVGDWVICNGFKATIAGYNAESGSIQVLTKQKNKMWFGIDDISPIPIKAEILERNGFESTTKPNVFTLTHGKLQLYVSKELDGWAMSFVNFMERLYYLQVIRKSYIHELQHALRLAGVEKEITL